jgi:hypothetical protein
VQLRKRKKTRAKTNKYVKRCKWLTAKEVKKSRGPIAAYDGHTYVGMIARPNIKFCCICKRPEQYYYNKKGKQVHEQLKKVVPRLYVHISCLRIQAQHAAIYDDFVERYRKLHEISSERSLAHKTDLSAYQQK